MIRIKTRLPINDVIDLKLLRRFPFGFSYDELSREYEGIAVLDVDAFKERCDQWVFSRRTANHLNDLKRVPVTFGPIMQTLRKEELCEQSTQSH